MADALDDCSICLDTIKTLGRLDCCDHYFCYDCIYKWSQSSNTCPLCKKRFAAISKIKPPTKKRRASPSSPTPSKRQKLENPVTKVPFRDLQETYRQQEGNSLLELIFRAIMVERQRNQGAGGVIDLTEEDAPPRNNYPVYQFHGMAERIDVTDDDDLPMHPPPRRVAPQQQRAMVIDLTDD